MMILYRFRAAISICVRGTRHAPISIQIIWPFVDVPILLLLDVNTCAGSNLIQPTPVIFLFNDCPCIWWLVM